MPWRAHDRHASCFWTQCPRTWRWQQTRRYVVIATETGKASGVECNLCHTLGPAHLLGFTSRASFAAAAMEALKRRHYAACSLALNKHCHSLWQCCQYAQTLLWFYVYIFYISIVFFVSSVHSDVYNLFNTSYRE